MVAEIERLSMPRHKSLFVSFTQDCLGFVFHFSTSYEDLRRIRACGKKWYEYLRMIVIRKCCGYHSIVSVMMDVVGTVVMVDNLATSVEGIITTELLCWPVRRAFRHTWEFDELP